MLDHAAHHLHATRQSLHQKIAPSKVKYDDALVPTTAPTVIFAYERVSVSGATIEHCTVVCDDHDTVEHKSTPSAEALAVKLYEPKLSPLIVTVDPPLSGPPLATSSSKDVLTTGAAITNPGLLAASESQPYPERMQAEWGVRALTCIADSRCMQAHRSHISSGRAVHRRK
jgi:hypothetical protein